MTVSEAAQIIVDLTRELSALREVTVRVMRELAGERELRRAALGALHAKNQELIRLEQRNEALHQQLRALFESGRATDAALRSRSAA